MQCQDKEIELYLTIIMLYEQQKHMYGNNTHSAEHRIVSISQPWFHLLSGGEPQPRLTSFALSVFVTNLCL